jgi:hypothetical protein
MHVLRIAETPVNTASRTLAPVEEVDHSVLLLGIAGQVAMPWLWPTGHEPLGVGMTGTHQRAAGRGHTETLLV